MIAPSTALLGVMVVAAAAAAAPVPKALKKQPTLDGRWEAITLRSSGSDFLKGSPWVWDIDGESVTRHYKQPDGTLRKDGPATIARPDPAKSDEIDYLLPSGKESVLFRARIAIDGDELTINFADLNEPRPDDMTEQRRGYYYRFKRVEK